jgi:uncharacterized CHY-type Zn-finger protein
MEPIEEQSSAKGVNKICQCTGIMELEIYEDIVRCKKCRKRFLPKDKSLTK